MKTNITLFFLILNMFIYGQKTAVKINDLINKKNSKGEKQGYWFEDAAPIRFQTNTKHLNYYYTNGYYFQNKKQGRWDYFSIEQSMANYCPIHEMFGIFKNDTMIEFHYYEDKIHENLTCKYHYEKDTIAILKYCENGSLISEQYYYDIPSSMKIIYNNPLDNGEEGLMPYLFVSKDIIRVKEKGKLWDCEKK